MYLSVWTSLYRSDINALKSSFHAVPLADQERIFVDCPRDVSSPLHCAGRSGVSKLLVLDQVRTEMDPLWFRGVWN